MGTSLTTRARVLNDIALECVLHERNGHTGLTDDLNTINDWCAKISRHNGLAVTDLPGGQQVALAGIDQLDGAARTVAIERVERARRQMIRIASLAIKAVESIDRLTRQQFTYDVRQHGTEGRDERAAP